MTFIWRCLCIITVICSEAFMCNSSFVIGIINGTLTKSWEFNFTIFAEELKGVILYCFDSEGKQFGIIVTKGSNNVGSIQINYNRIYKIVLLKLLCGCDPCNRTMIQFHFRLDNVKLIGNCNKQKPEILSIVGHQQYSEKGNYQYPIPNELVNTSGLIAIRVGNIGPYVSKDNKKIYPNRDQLIGCVKSFTYNNNSIKFQGEGTQIKPMCLKKCTDTICNTGRCIETIMGNISCDCSMAAHNGEYCNKSLQSYIPGTNNSYVKRNEISLIQFKMSWRQFNDKRYCLLNVVSRFDNFTLTIERKHLHIGTRIISNISDVGFNFVHVEFADNNFIIKTKYNTSKLEFSQIEILRINVGFSENNDSCEIFEGTYDFLYNKSQLRYANWILSSTFVQISTTVNVSDHNQPNGKMTFIYIGLSIFVFLVCALNLIIIRKYKKTKAPDNTYDIEPIGCEVAPVQPYYSSLDYQGINDVSDDYIEPQQSRQNSIPPPLPGNHPVKDTKL